MHSRTSVSRRLHGVWRAMVVRGCRLRIRLSSKAGSSAGSGGGCSRSSPDLQREAVGHPVRRARRRLRRAADQEVVTPRSSEGRSARAASTRRCSIAAYPTGGTGEVYERMAVQIRARGGTIKLSTPVRSLEPGAKITVRTDDGVARTFDHAISSMPLTLFASRLPDPRARDRGDARPHLPQHDLGVPRGRRAATVRRSVAVHPLARAADRPDLELPQLGTRAVRRQAHHHPRARILVQ